MARKRFTAEQIIIKLREAEVELAKGQPPAEVCRKLGVTEQTYYRWRKEYGGLRVNQAKRLKLLETENARLKKLVADQALDIPRETSEPAPTAENDRACPPGVGGIGAAGLPGSRAIAIDAAAQGF